MLNSLPSEINKIIVDGKFSLSGHTSKLSPKSIRDKVLEYDNITIIDSPGLMEHEIRNKYLELSDGYDFMLWLDSDEYLVNTDWNLVFKQLEKLPKQAGIYGIMEYYMEDERKTAYPKIYTQPYKIRCYKAHNIYNIAGSIGRPVILKIINNIEAKFDDKLRSKKYLDVVADYQTKMMIYEKPIRHAVRDGISI